VFFFCYRGETPQGVKSLPPSEIFIASVVNRDQFEAVLLARITEPSVSFRYLAPPRVRLWDVVNDVFIGNDRKAIFKGNISNRLIEVLVRRWRRLIADHDQPYMA